MEPHNNPLYTKHGGRKNMDFSRVIRASPKRIEYPINEKVGKKQYPIVPEFNNWDYLKDDSPLHKNTAKKDRRSSPIIFKSHPRTNNNSIINSRSSPISGKIKRVEKVHLQPVSHLNSARDRMDRKNRNLKKRKALLEKHNVNGNIFDGSAKGKIDRAQSKKVTIYTTANKDSVDFSLPREKRRSRRAIAREVHLYLFKYTTDNNK